MCKRINGATVKEDVACKKIENRARRNGNASANVQNSIKTCFLFLFPQRSVVFHFVNVLISQLGSSPGPLYSAALPRFHLRVCVCVCVCPTANAENPEFGQVPRQVQSPELGRACASSPHENAAVHTVLTSGVRIPDARGTEKLI